MKEEQHIINILNYILIIVLELIILYILKKNNESVDNIKIIFAIINVIVIISFITYKVIKKEFNVKLIILSIFSLLVTMPLLWFDNLKDEYNRTRMRPESKCSQAIKCEETNTEGKFTCSVCADTDCKTAEKITCDSN